MEQKYFPVCHHTVKKIIILQIPWNIMIVFASHVTHPYRELQQNKVFMIILPEKPFS